MTINIDPTALKILQGYDPGPRDGIKDAVASRIETISAAWTRHPGFNYQGPRCVPENLGWRFVQEYRIQGRGLDKPSTGLGPSRTPRVYTPQAILDGEWDDLLERVFQLAAEEEADYLAQEEFCAF